MTIFNEPVPTDVALDLQTYLQRLVDKINTIDVDISTGSGIYALIGHNHNSTYLGISAQAVDSNLLDGQDGTWYLARANHTGTQLASTISDFSTAADARITLQKGAINGLATLDGAGLVPASQLPSYVDDVLEYANLAAFPATGETGKIYVALDTGKTWRWTGSVYVEIPTLAADSDKLQGQDGAYYLAWANFTGTPTTLAGYGITDAALATHNHTFDSLSNVTITAIAAGEIPKWSGSAWINNTLAEAGIEPAFSKNTAFNKNFGTIAGTVTEGNDSRLSDARTPLSHGNEAHTSTFITASSVTYETLVTNGDVGTSAGQLAIGNHLHTGVYEPIFTKNTAFNKDFAGTGVASTVARSDHNHNTTYLGITAKASDSDKLDNIDSTQFVRSDVADQVDGVLTFTAIPAFNGGLTGTSAPFTVDSTFKVTNLNADLLDGFNTAQSVVISTIPVRDSAGDIFARLFRSNYAEQTTAPATTADIAFRNSTTDDYIRFMSNTAFSTWCQNALIKTYDSARLGGQLPSVTAGNNTIVQRHSSGYIYANYFNTTAAFTATAPTAVMVETSSDGFMRKQTLANLAIHLGIASSELYTLTGLTPELRFNETDQVANLRNWRMFSSGGIFTLETATDVWGSLDQVITATRNGANSILTLGSNNWAVHLTAPYSAGAINTGVATTTTTPTYVWVEVNDQASKAIRPQPVADFISNLGLTTLGSIPDWHEIRFMYETVLTVSTAAMIAMNSTDVVSVDNANDNIRVFRSGGNGWFQVGSSFALGAVTFMSICRLNSTDICFFDSGGADQLKVYRFNGSTWSQVGTSFTISTTGAICMCALTTTDIAFMDPVGPTLKTYRFNGTTWSQVGSTFTLTGVIDQLTDITALNSTDIILADKGTNTLKAYRFNGTTWSQLGNSISITTATYNSISALNSTDIVHIADTTDRIRIYRFDGTNFTLLQASCGMTVGTAVPNITCLDGQYIAYIDEAADRLRKYRVIPVTDFEGPYHP